MRRVEHSLNSILGQLVRMIADGSRALLFLSGERESEGGRKDAGWGTMGPRVSNFGVIFDDDVGQPLHQLQQLGRARNAASSPSPVNRVCKGVKGGITLRLFAVARFDGCGADGPFTIPVTRRMGLSGISAVDSQLSHESFPTNRWTNQQVI